MCLSEKAPAGRNRATGPKTDEGKSIASQISRTHGLTTRVRLVNGELTELERRRMILPDESEQAWEELLQSWLDEYAPENIRDKSLIIEAAISEWQFHRTQRRHWDLEQSFFKTQPDATLWTAENYAQLDRFLRYRTAAERSFCRLRNVVEQTRRWKHLHQATSPAPAKPSAAPRTDEKPRCADAPTPIRETSAPKPPPAVIQCVTVQVLEGKTFTLFQPRNEYFGRMIESALDPRPLVKRALYFLHGIPAEYAWIKEYENHAGRPHFVIERSCEEALQDLERERQDSSGHVLPIPPADAKD